MARFFLVCFAGALGTGARYLVGLGAGRYLGTSFPFGTLLVNLVGCFVLAGVAELAMDTAMVSPTLRVVLGTGFCGGLTTYSSFNLETSRLLQEGAWRAASLNLAATLAGCFVAGLLGIVAARRMIAP
jgi:fluoride exporter